MDEDLSGTGPAGSLRTLLFRVGERVYGCDITAVREIVPFRVATRLPGSPPFVLGLINLRGILTTVVDLGGWLEPGGAPAHGGSIVLVDHGSRQAGLVVDEMLDVQAIVPEALGDISSARGGVLKGVGRMGETVVILLDVSALVEQVLA